MNYLQIAILVFILIGLIVYFRQKKNVNSYDFANPMQRFELPSELKEISGLSFFKNNQLVAINDEQGIIFIYDLDKKQVTQRLEFAKSGDFEGVEVVENELFVLESNGIITVINLNNNTRRKTDCSLEEVKEYEGLGYNPKINSLLLVTKEKKKKSEKTIYAYSLTTESFTEYIAISEDIIKGANNKKFAPSGIAFHPLTNDLYILSSQGKKLLILTPDGKKQAIIDLDQAIFSQPEGICFAPNGDMYISSEGVAENGYILKFDFRNEN